MIVMNGKIKVLLIVLLVAVFSVTGTYCIYATIQTEETDIYIEEKYTRFLEDDLFLDKVQALDPSITSIDKTTDLHRVTTIPTVTLTDDNIVSEAPPSSDSPEVVPTYLWVDNGVIYYFTIADDIDFNIDDNEG
jgi:hypothetical protein